MRSILRSLRWLGGPLIWAAYFLIVYASESLICSRGAGAQAHLTLVMLTTIPAFGAILWLAVINARGRHDARFEASVGLGLAGLSLVATAWTGFASAMLPACG